MYAKSRLVLLLGCIMAWPLVPLADDYYRFSKGEAETSVPEERREIVGSELVSADDEEPVANGYPGEVSHSAFTTAIVDREPVDRLTGIPPGAGEVYFFTELINMTGQTAVHRWDYQGEMQAEVAFDVGGPRWRVWSRKALLPEWDGEWTVSVVNGAGEVIHRESVMYAGPGVQPE